MRILYSGGVGGDQGVFDKHFPETQGLSIMLTFYQIKTGTKEDQLKKVRSDTTRRFKALAKKRKK